MSGTPWVLPQPSVTFKENNMAVRTLIERTIWVAKCPKCEEVVEKDINPPRERCCMRCNEWIPFVSFSSISPEYKALQK